MEKRLIFMIEDISVQVTNNLRIEESLIYGSYLTYFLSMLQYF